jgi:hypothetical protein
MRGGAGEGWVMVEEMRGIRTESESSRFGEMGFWGEKRGQGSRGSGVTRKEVRRRVVKTELRGMQTLGEGRAAKPARSGSR